MADCTCAGDTAVVSMVDAWHCNDCNVSAFNISSIPYFGTSSFIKIFQFRWLLLFYSNCFGGHKSFLLGHWYPCFIVLVKSPLGFKARADSLIRAWWRHMHYCVTCSLGFTSGATLADHRYELNLNLEKKLMTFFGFPPTALWQFIISVVVVLIVNNL